MTAWYGAGLQAIDYSDAENPISAGEFRYRLDDRVAESDSGFAGADTYDVVFGDGGYIYVADGTSGLRVVKYTRP